MNKWTEKYVRLAITNLNLALDMNEPEITWAVLVNIQSTIEGYIQQTYHEKHGKGKK